MPYLQNFLAYGTPVNFSKCADNSTQTKKAETEKEEQKKPFFYEKNAKNKNKNNEEEQEFLCGLMISVWPFSGTCWELHKQTDRQTDTNTGVATYRLNRPSENKK